MALFYRLVVFGKPKGPWRYTEKMARQDALELELGSYDEDGQFYLTAPADFEWIHEDQLRLRA